MNPTQPLLSGCGLPRFVLVSLALLMCAQVHAGDLFQSTSWNHEVKRPVDTKIIERLDSADWIKDYRLVEVDTTALHDSNVVISLFNGASIRASGALAEPSSEDSRSWIGKTSGSEVNNVVITFNNDGLTGNISVEAGDFKFWTLPNGLCVVVRVNENRPPKYY